VFASAGTNVDDPVAGLDRLFVVLDDKNSVAKVAQANQRVDQALVVALVQPDRRFIEHVERSDKPAADLARKSDALRFPTGKSSSVARQGEIVEADVEQEPKPGVDLLRDALGDQPIALTEFEAGKELRRLGDRHLADLRDVLAVHRDSQR